MFGFGKKKVDKGAWAEAVYGKRLSHPEKESEERLSALTTEILAQHHRIITESSKIIRSTKNPDTRQSREALCHENYRAMMKIKPFCNKEQLAMIQDAEMAMRAFSYIEES